MLKGPQGTLYGRNSSGGALNILTNAPVLGQTFGTLNAEVGNYNEINTDGSFNVPLSDKLALRGAFQIVSRSGYSSQGFDDDKKESARLSLLWKPNDDVSLRVTAAYTHVGGLGPGYDFDTHNYPAAVSAQRRANHERRRRAGGWDHSFRPIRASVSQTPRVCGTIFGMGR